jgi:hypothetical protein
MRIIEALSGFSDSFPTIFDPGDSVLVKRDSTLCQVPSPKNSRMISGDRNEHYCWDCQPIRGEVMSFERSPRHDRKQERQNKPNASQAYMNFLVVGNARLASLQTLDVFFERRHRLRG